MPTVCQAMCQGLKLRCHGSQQLGLKGRVTKLLPFSTAMCEHRGPERGADLSTVTSWSVTEPEVYPHILSPSAELTL